jgi:alpha-N-arabinofuranosidase
MEELVTRHSAVMDKYDPRKRVAIAVDEWGGWYDVEPGTNGHSCSSKTRCAMR